jgi:hypothetical protein
VAPSDSDGMARVITFVIVSLAAAAVIVALSSLVGRC